MITARAEDGLVLVIGHRGASGHRPENTLPAFELAIRLGADRIEPDVVPTADGALVLRHESDLSHSTDIADRPPAGLRRTPTGRTGAVARTAGGWCTEEMTLAQVRSVRAVEPRPSLRRATTSHDGLHPVPTLGELLDLTAALGEELGPTTTVTAEVKEPARFAARGLDVAALVVAELTAHGIDVGDDLGGAPRGGPPAVALQCFDPRFLVRLRCLGVALPLVQLVSRWPLAGAGAPGWAEREAMCTPAGLAEVGTYAQVLAVAKDLVLPVARDGSWAPATPLVADAHAAGLAVHVYTLRDENAHLPPPLRLGTAPDGHGLALAEHLAFARAGVDGIFTDFVDTGVRARSLLGAGAGAGAGAGDTRRAAGARVA